MYYRSVAISGTSLAALQYSFSCKESEKKKVNMIVT